METINTDDCAKLLFCTTERIEELARKGEIPGIKLGRSWCFVREDLLDFLADKARDEAALRRQAMQIPIKPSRSRRQQPPKLPNLPRRFGL